MKLRLRIYTASSWRNENYPAVVAALKEHHSVYDFRRPCPDSEGFSWSLIDPNWQQWSWREYIAHLETNPVVAAAFELDKNALNRADVCVLVTPAGNSSHLELGYAAGAGKSAIVLIDPTAPVQADLMYRLCDGIGGVRFAFGVEELLELLRAEARRKWFSLPLHIRRWWWRETDYGSREPTPELLAAIEVTSRHSDAALDEADQS
jgi:hypothetical protein